MFYSFPSMRGSTSARLAVCAALLGTSWSCRSLLDNDDVTFSDASTTTTMGPGTGGSGGDVTSSTMPTTSVGGGGAGGQEPTTSVGGSVGGGGAGGGPTCADVPDVAGNPIPCASSSCDMLPDATHLSNFDAVDT